MVKICCIGDGYVGGPTMAVIALKCPKIEVVVVDIAAPRTNAWNSEQLPIYESVLDDVVKQYRGRNLFFSIDVEKHVSEADINNHIKDSFWEFFLFYYSQLVLASCLNLELLRMIKGRRSQ